MDALLSEFPTRESNEPATKDFVHSECNVLRVEMVEMRGELKAEIAGLRTELKAEIAGLRTELLDRMQQQMHWTIGILVSAITVSTALGVALN